MAYNKRLLLKGNEAAVYGALLAGCDCYFGYPITPASEIAQAAALLFPKLNRTFVQAESEIGAINMVIGCAAAGRRTMTASSGLGISLKQEGMSYLAAYEMPAVIVDVMRGGPGLGNIGPEQSDYFQVVKGGGHGSYRCLVFTPNSVQEMCDMTFQAFPMAEKYRMPAYVLTDGVIGQMMESLELPEPVKYDYDPEWKMGRRVNGEANIISSIYMEYNDLEALNIRLQEKYALIQKTEQRVEEIAVDEEQHMRILGEIITALGGDPLLRVGKGYYWTGEFVRPAGSVLDYLKANILAEKNVIAEYNRRLKAIDDPYIREVLARILVDEQSHLDALVDAEEICFLFFGDIRNDNYFY